MEKWFRDLKTILIKDLISTRRVKKYLFAALVPPMVVLIIFSTFVTVSNPEAYTVILVDEDDTNYSKLMDNYICNISSEFAPWFNVIKMDSYQEARQKLDSYEYLGLIFIPAGFENNLTSGDPLKKVYIQLYVQNINNDYVKNYIQRMDEAVLTFNQKIHVSSGHVDNFALISKKYYFISQNLSFLKGITVGIIAMYGIICGLCYGSLNVAKEYENQTILEIINSPISRTAFIASKQLIGVVIGTIFTFILSIILYLSFDIQFTGNLLFVLIAYLLSTWTHAGIGCLIGLKFKKFMPVILISIISSIFMWLFTGGLAPINILGDLIVIISKIFPATYWGEILFAETFIPNLNYTLSRVLILSIMSLGITGVSWYIINKKGFKL